jgi:enoyl-CoA hydratase/carnithine racemase
VYEDLTYEEQGHVGVITLRRPEARNALTFKTYAELEDAVRTTTARCLVITGADPAFCSGDDVKVVMGGGERPPDVSSSLARTPRLTPAADALLHTDVPVVAAVNGAAVGWGMELSPMADFRVASEKARFGELFVLRGLVSDAPGLGRLAAGRSIGRRDVDDRGSSAPPRHCASGCGVVPDELLPCSGSGPSSRTRRPVQRSSGALAHSILTG